MAIEIERKFLVTGDGWRDGIVAATRIRQGYLTRDAAVTVRVRRREGRASTVTIKGPRTGASKPEYEWEVSDDDAAGLMALAGDRTVDKTRHEVRWDGRLWEVDVFHGRHEGLVIAELELAAEDEAVALPVWTGAEVTEDAAFYNAALALGDEGWRRAL